MLHKSTCLLASAGVAVLLAQPSTAWAQAVGPDLVISMSHRGNFTVGVSGDYTIVVSNIGRTASSGWIEVDSGFVGGPTTGIWSCISIILNIHFPPYVKCFTSSVIAPGASASPLTLSLTPFDSGTLRNTVSVGGRDTFTLQLGYRVPQGSSGPFGEDTYGPWWTKTEIAQRYSDIRRRFFAAGVPIEQCWYDLHASRVMNVSRP